MSNANIIAKANEILNDDDFADVRKPLESASAPPGYYYTSKNLFDLEVEQIFLKEWLWVGHVGQVEKKGDYFTFDHYGNERVLVAKDKKGNINAFSAICRHRGALAASGEGNCNFFRCPYHAWVYGLDGKLLSAPDMDGVQDFDRADFGLVPLKIDFWEGLIFINFDPDCKPLSDTLGNLPERVAKYKLGEQVWVNRKVYDFECNWKVTSENAMDEYHLAGTHATEGVTEYETMSHWQHMDDCEGNYDMMVFTGTESMTQSATSDGGGTIRKPSYTIDGLSEDELKQHFFIMLYPNLMITFMPDSSGIFVIVPDGHNKSKVIYDWYYPKGAMEQDGFQEIAEGGYAGVSGFINQDVTVLNLTQKGYESSRYKPGRFSLYEPLPYRTIQYVLNRLTGSKD